MKSYIICEKEQTLLGMRLAGIGGIVAGTKKEVEENIIKLLNDNETGIIMVSENIFSKNAEFIMEKKLTERKKLIIQIPEQEGLKDKNYIVNYIKSSVGIKL